ncbi:MAG: beta-galactosidase [Dehalococcoidia bacterium]|nr:beta-galactosidase [Dehalococcoidia bacterium]
MIRKRRRVRIVAICGLGAMAAVLLVGQFWLMSALSWTHREPPADSLIGINFSCDQAEYLLLETPGGPFVPDDRPGRAKWCGDVLARIIDATGARSVRFSVQWDEVEPSQGAYDFSLTDELLRVAADHGASVMVGIDQGSAPSGVLHPRLGAGRDGPSAGRRHLRRPGAPRARPGDGEERHSAFRSERDRGLVERRKRALHRVPPQRPLLAQPRLRRRGGGRHPRERPRGAADRDQPRAALRDGPALA